MRGRNASPPKVAASLAEHLSDEALTEREIDVLRHVAGGNRNRDIAERLFISEETVKVHMKHIMEKLGASERARSPLGFAGGSSSYKPPYRRIVSSP